MAHGFGIIGCGMIANFHADAIKKIDGAEVVACFDMFPASADKYAEAQGCKAYHDLDAMLADGDVDIVTICTPSGAHMEPGVKVARAGKHLLVEKPLEIRLEKCDAIIKACDSAGVQLGTIMPSRFSEANIALKNAIDAGRFGRLTLGDTYVKWWRTQEYYDSGGWRGTWELDGGGSYMNQAIHNVDLLYWLMGDVDQVCGMTATLAHERIEVEDVGAAVVKFKNGAIGTLEATTSAFPGLLKKTEIHGTKGTVIVEQDDILMWQFEDETDDDAEIRQRFGRGSATTGGASDPSAISSLGHQKQFEEFIDAIESGRTPVVDGHEGRKSVELILAIYDSAWSGKRVTLPLTADPTPPAQDSATA